VEPGRRPAPAHKSQQRSDDSGKTAHTTHRHHITDFVKITRPQHPFEGKSLAVFGSRRQQGRLHLILELPDGSRSLIPAEWTDLHGCRASRADNGTLASIEDLLRSRGVVDALQRRLARDGGEMANLNPESACANQAELHRGRRIRSTARAVGSTEGGAQTGRD